MPGVPWRRALDARTKSARLVSVSSFGQAKTAGGPSIWSAGSLSKGATGGFKTLTDNWRLCAQLRPAFGAAVVQDTTTSFCRHTCAKAVTVLTNAVRWLERALHSGVLWFLGQTHKWIRSRSTIQTCPLERVPRGVNAQGRYNLQQLPEKRSGKCYSHHETARYWGRLPLFASTRRERGRTSAGFRPFRMKQPA